MSEIDYLLSLEAVRDRAGLVFEAAQEGDLTHFTYHAERMSDVADFVTQVIDRDFGPDKYSIIPPHGRWQHFDVGGINRVAQLIEKWEANGIGKVEVCRRLVDLFFVSVLLDAGAGDHWRYTEPTTQNVYERSEGIAVASLYMFNAGAFGSEDTVDGFGLCNLIHSDFERSFQISDNNPMIGTVERVKLLNTVGQSLLGLPAIFGENRRPGNLVDYILSSSTASNPLDFKALWTALQSVLIPSWPKDRTHIDGKPIGDAWPLEVLKRRSDGKEESASSHLQPFHKLTQWLAYSLTVPFVRVLGFEWTNTELGTGLPEYRNGGLFVDLGVLQLKPEVLQLGRENTGAEQPGFPANSDVIVEWRAMTVALLDELHKIIKASFLEKGVTLSMAQMLEAGTWKGGRELAAKHRPETRMSPIVVMGDGTLF